MLERTKSLPFALLGGSILPGIVCPLLFMGQTISDKAESAFDVVSIKRLLPVSDGQGVLRRDCVYSADRVICQSSVLELVEEAYQVKEIEIAGPAWLNDDVFAVQAIMPSGTAKDKARLMLQGALSDRFQLRYHWETRPIRVYALVSDKHGLKLQAAADPDHRDRDKIAIPGTSGMRASVLTQQGRFYAVAMSLDELATSYLSVCAGAPVINMTGQTTAFKIDLRWTPTEGPGFSYAVKDPEFLTTVEKQLGLQLEKRTLPFKVLVVDHIERVPSAN